MKIRFQGSAYGVVFTEHAKLQMDLRRITEQDVLEVVRTGDIKPKNTLGKFWVFKNLSGRKDNLIAVAISIEEPYLIVVTTMVNWRPL